jgi:predicted  nucleic acid-binding Zn-ribbon protein
MPHQCTNCGHVFADGSKEMLSGCPDCGGNKFQYHPGDVPEEEPPADAEAPEAEGGSVTGAVGRAANKVRDAVTSDPQPPAGRTGDDAQSGDVAPDAVTADSSGVDLDDPQPAGPETGGDQARADQSESTQTEADANASTTDTAADESATDAADTSPADSEQSHSDPEVNAGMADSEDTAQASARSDVVDPDSLPDAPEDGRVVKEPDDPEDRPDLEDLRSELNDQFESIRIVAPGQYELNLMELYDRQEYIIALQEDGQYVIEVPDAWETDE